MEKTKDTKGSKGKKLGRRTLTHLLHRDNGQAPCPHHWFQRKKSAAREIRKTSGETLELVSSVYHGDDRQHKILHLACGRAFWGSLSDIRAKKGRICPFCHEAADLRQIGRREEVQRYVLEASDGRAYFFSANTLGPVSERYHFMCFVHGPYRTTFSRFLTERGEANGCPMCSEPAPKPRERRGNVIFL